MISKDNEAVERIRCTEPRNSFWQFRPKLGLLGLLVTVSAACIALAYVTTPTKYVTTSTIRVIPIQLKSAHQPLDTTATLEDYRQHEANHLSSDEFISRAVSDVRDRCRYILLSRAPTWLTYDWLRKSIQVELPNNSDLIRVTLRGTEGDVAVQKGIVNSVVDTYIRHRAYQRLRRDGEQSFPRQLDDSSADRKAFELRLVKSAYSQPLD